MRKIQDKLSVHMTHHSNKQSGFTLVEMMIAAAIGAVLLGGMISVFLGNKKTADLNEAMVEMQQSARFALDVLARDIRMSGFQGCVDLETSTANAIADSRPTNNLAATAIMGAVVAGNDIDPPGPIGFTLPVGGSITPIQGSDVLSVQFGSQETFVVNPMTSASAPVVVQTLNPGISNGDLVLISNCQVADIFEVSEALNNSLKHDGTVNSGKNELSAAYGVVGEENRPRAMRFESNVFFIADTGRTNRAGDTVRSLFKQSLPYTSNPVEVIEGVELLAFRFGLRGDESADITFVNPEDLGDQADNIVSVQIGLLMQSHDRVRDDNDTKSYTIAGNIINATAHAGDRRLRMPFNSTVKVRNRQ